MRHYPPESVILSGVWRGFMRQTQSKDLLAAHLTSTSDPFQPAVNAATRQRHRQSTERSLARLHAPLSPGICHPERSLARLHAPNAVEGPASPSTHPSRQRLSTTNPHLAHPSPQPHSTPTSAWRPCALALLCLLTAFAHAAPKPEKPGTPYLQLPLDTLGFPGVSAPFLDSGASMLTVDFIDNTHLLLTYSERILVPRIPNDPDAGIDDRVVAAKVVDLPSGRVLTTAHWHMHDHGRYLWKLGSGSFLVRIGQQLYTISPLAQLAVHGDVLMRTVFPGRPLRPTAVLSSPDSGLVTLETVVKPATSTGQTIIVVGDTDSPLAEQTGSKTLIDFFRLQHGKDGVQATPAGSITAPSPFFLPIDADGLLWAQQAAVDQWAVTFDSFTGKTLQLGSVPSSCQPRLQLLSPSEFLAISCRGGDDRLKLASYGLDGKETWEESVGDFGIPSFALAPTASRFAISHTVAAVVPDSAGASGIPARQEVRVYQNASGDLLLKVECTPIVKSAENFDLSEDGSQLVVIRNGALTFYKLPALSVHDREDIAEVAHFAPPPVTQGNIRLPRLTGPAKPATSTQSAANPSVHTPPTPDTPVPPDTPALSAVPASTHRKPPTFLEPGEKPEFGTPNEAPPSNPPPNTPPPQ